MMSLIGYKADCDGVLLAIASFAPEEAALDHATEDVQQNRGSGRIFLPACVQEAGGQQRVVTTQEFVVEAVLRVDGD
jgi:hypothetical protein